MFGIVKNDCVDVLTACLGTTCFSLDEFEVHRFEQCLGLHANYATLRIRATVSGEDKEFNFFVKIQNGNPEIYEAYWKHTGQFCKERIFLTTIVKELETFVDQKITAKCYLSKPGELLVMEDLNSSGFEMSRAAPGDYEHAEVAIKAFANFHASSLLCQEQTGVRLQEKFCSIDFETLFFCKEGIDDCLLNSIEKSLKSVAVKYLSDWNGNKINALFDTIRDAILTSLSNPKKYESVICQGDPWGNNILYKYDDTGKPLTAVLVDFGSLRFGPPSLDLMQFIYINTSKTSRTQFKSQILDTYYKTLTDILSKSGLDGRKIFPKERYCECCEYYERFAVAVNVYYNYVTRLPEMYMKRAVDAVDNYLGLLVRGDATLPLEACENDENYRKAVVSSLEEASLYFQSHGGEK